MSCRNSLYNVRQQYGYVPVQWNLPRLKLFKSVYCTVQILERLEIWPIFSQIFIKKHRKIQEVYKYFSVSQTSSCVAKQDVKNKMTKSMQNRMQKEFLYFHQISFSEIIFNYWIQSIAKEFGLIEQEGTQKNHSIENLHHKMLEVASDNLKYSHEQSWRKRTFLKSFCMLLKCCNRSVKWSILKVSSMKTSKIPYRTEQLTGLRKLNIIPDANKPRDFPES